MENKNLHKNTAEETAAENAIIAEMEQVSAGVEAPPEVLRSVLGKLGWQRYLSAAYFSRSWRIAVPAALAVVLIFAGVLRENVSTSSSQSGANGSSGAVALNTSGTSDTEPSVVQTDPNDDSNQAIDQDLSSVDSEMSGLDSDLSNVDSEIDDSQTS